jgi:small subunit ribosomal protein S2
MSNKVHKELLRSRAHLGHKTASWNPKMFPYIFTEKDGKHLIDITKTAKMLDEACEFTNKSARVGKKFLFVGTKPQATAVVAFEAERCNSYYINYRWLGGMLTNWTTVQVRINRLNELKDKQLNGGFDNLPKKELSRARKELAKLEKYLKGIKDMPSSPDVIIIVDPTFEMTAIREAIALDIPIIALIDTNGNPDLIDFPIPSNADSILTISFILKKLSDNILG